MKPNIRSRRVVLQSVKHEPTKASEVENKNIINPSRFPRSRIILRKQKKQEEGPAKVEKTQTQKQSQPDHLSENLTENVLPRISNKDQEEQELVPVEFLEARDRRTVMKYDFTQKKYTLDKQRSKLNQWLGEMHFKVVSSSFNLYITNELTFEEVKVHCCQNLLLNILIFLEHLTKNENNEKSSFSLVSSFKSRFKLEPLSHLQLTEILKEINQTLIKNLAYMQIKYPLTKDTKPNKSLQSLIYKINNLGNDQHDMVMKSGVDFKLKNEDNYTPQIMKFLNFIINKQSQPCKVKGRHNKELTYFQFFYETIQTIFTSIYKPQYEETDKNEKPISHEYIDAVNLFANIMSNKQIQETDEEILSKEGKQYKEKVMKYTHYLIGCKISPNTELYSDKQIEAQIFDVRNSSILRILTKWTEELENKIVESEQNILKRPFRFKKNKPYEYSKLNANQKNDLYQETKRRARDVRLFNEELQENYNEIESMISSHLDQTEEMKNIPRKEYKVGYFCSKIQVAASSTLLSYLNKMIHILLMIPDELKKNHPLDEQYTENMNINLVTFKIADLFRCKIKSKQAEIVRIFKKIKQISEKGEPFKIVRIKDRLNLGTRDILINILFMNIFLCEIQLAVEEYVDSKQVSYDSFSHFLYELHRSRLGPIMESACTWAQFDQRSKIFRHLAVDKSHEQARFIPHYCDKQYMITNRYPFICSLCERFYSTEKGLLKHVKCNLCRTYFECTQCIYSKLTPEKISKLVHLPEKLGIFIDDFKLWSFNDEENAFPKFGLITSKNVKKPDIKFFQTVIFKYNAYLINVVEDDSRSGEFKLEIIEKIQGNLSKNWKKIEENYIIYEWKQKRNFNQTITPEVMVRAMEEEKEKREKAAKAKKDEKQKRREQLEAKRKQRDEISSDQDEKKKKKKHHRDSDSETEKNETSKNITSQKKIAIYHETVAKKTNYFKVRVIEKETNTSNEIFVLGIFLKESAIRNRLKEMSNKNILHRITLQKIEVLFFEDQYIHNQINQTDDMTEAQKQELKETMERVSEVYLDNNFLERIDFISIMTALKVAHLSNNLINDLDPLLELKYLTQLIMENNEITDLQGLKNKPEITEINLNRNKLTNLAFFSQCEDGQFSHLKNFFLSGNQIEQLSGLEKLPSLVKLDLSYNEIEKIGDIKTLLNLEELDISSNHLRKVKGIQNFPNLKKLYLSENKLKKISKEISELIFLQTLDMSQNRIKKIENLNQGAISKNLKHLNLSDNIISVMQGLDGMENLISLNLSHNNIKQIDNYLDLNSLVKFDISHNCLEEVDLEDAKKYLPCLKEVYLNSNPLLNNEFNKNVITTLSKHVQIIKVNLREDQYEMK